MGDFLIVGLGNPGKEYEHTRHNAGADVVSELARRFNVSLKHEKIDSSILGSFSFEGSKVLLAFPQTYMNESGRVLPKLLKRVEVSEWTSLIVIHDELDLELGTVRVKVGGGLAGHNGLRSITATLKTQDYCRIRLGISKPPGGKDNGADHVLKKLRGESSISFEQMIDRGADAAEMILRKGPDAAMSEFNRTE